MKILIVTTNVVKWGGSEELWRNVALEALQAGHEVMVSVFMHKPLSEKVLSLAQRGAKIHKRPFPSYFVGQRFTGRALAELKLRTGVDKTDFDWKRVKAFKPDSVLISSGETFDYNISHNSFLVKYCLRNKVPFYLLSQFNWEHDMQITQEFRNSRAKLLADAEAQFFVSYRNWKNAQMQLAQPISNARIVNNPLKITADEPLPYPKKTTPTLALVARFQPFIKGQDLLLQTLAEPEFKEQVFTLNFYGKGDDKEHLKNLIEFYGLENKAFIHNHVEDVSEIWRVNQLFILTSRAEGTPLSLLEAMACGRSALVTNVGDSAYWVGDRGFVSEHNSVAALKKALINCFANFNNWEALGKESHQALHKNLNKNQAKDMMKCLTGEKSWQSVGKVPKDFLEHLKEVD